MHKGVVVQVISASIIESNKVIVLSGDASSSGSSIEKAKSPRSNAKYRLSI
jgi:hypothetical protein